jgi:hypothetical protein
VQPPAAVAELSGGACGYFANVAFLGGSQVRRGCGQPADGPEVGRSPEVELPQPGGSATPITATDADGAMAQYGPPRIFAGIWPDSEVAAPPSGPIAVGIEGTPAGGTVKSSVDIVLRAPPDPKWPGGVGPGPVEAGELHSRCQASDSGVSGTVHLVNGKLTTTTDAQGHPKDVEPVPENPPANYERTGEVTNVGDKFRVIYNEQIVNGNSITLNAVHVHLLGPVAVGELVIGQVRCSTTGSSADGTRTTSSAGTASGGSGAAGSAAPARTGFDVLRWVQVALSLMVMGGAATYWARPPQPECVRVKPPPWGWVR